MKIQDQDIYHGPALMQIVEHDSFKALNKADSKYGHYLVNKDIRLWFKYASSRDAPWQFTLQPDELTAIKEDLRSKGKLYLVLVCGHVSICCLNSDEVQSLADPNGGAAQWIKLDAPPNKKMRVTGSLNNKEPLKVAHSKFPNCIFGE